MALYLVHPGAGAPTLLVRARNGNRALEIVGSDDGTVARVREDGPEGTIAPDGGVEAAERRSPPPEEGGKGDPARPREVEITELSDRGVRRYRDLDTGAERSEPRADPSAALED